MTTPGASGPGFRRAEGVLSAEVGDEIVLMSVTHGRYFSLTGVGPRIWALIERPMGLEALVAALVEEYEVEEDVARSETSEFLAALRQRGLLVEVREG